jgi:PAS domain S-box-containing protein
VTCDTAVDKANRIDRQQDFRVLADILECSSDAIFSISSEGTIQSWNRAADRIYGYAAAEILGRSVHALYPGDRSNNANEILGRHKINDAVENAELICKRKDGRPIAALVAISPMKDSDGRVFGASIISRDITEQ